MPLWTYAEAKAKHAAYRGRLDGPKIANHTRLVRVDDGYAVRLHRTDVVTIHPDDTYTLRTGGWPTVTTKARLNAFSPVGVFQRRGQWYVLGRGPFRDCMRVSAGGEILSGPYTPPASSPAPEIVPAAVERARARVAANAMRGVFCEGHPDRQAVACWENRATNTRRFYCRECSDACVDNVTRYDHLHAWRQVSAAAIRRPARTRLDVIREAIGPGHPEYAVPREA